MQSKQGYQGIPHAAAALEGDKVAEQLPREAFAQCWLSLHRTPSGSIRRAAPDAAAAALILLHAGPSWLLLM